LNVIQERRSFVACPWLLHFAPLALGAEGQTRSIYDNTLLSSVVAVKRTGMLKRWISLLIIAVTISILAPVSTAMSAKSPDDKVDAAKNPSVQSQVPASRLARLRHGINLSHWFAQSADYSKAHLESHTTAEDLALIRSIGFDHVRLTLDPAPLFNGEDPGRLKAEHLKYLDSALDLILAQGLAVIVDIHPADEFKVRLNSNDRQIEAFSQNMLCHIFTDEIFVKRICLAMYNIALIHPAQDHFEREWVIKQKFEYCRG